MNPSTSTPAVVSSPPGKSRHVIRWLLGCLGVLFFLCCACTAGFGAWTWKQYTAYPTDPLVLTQIVEREVSQMRGLEFKQPVSVKLVTPDQMRAYLQKQFEKDMDPEEMRAGQLTLAAMDLIEPDTDLSQIYLDLFSEQTAGLYDPDTKQLYVVSDSSAVSVLGRTTLAHELTHALQDQYFDLNKSGYGTKHEHDSEYMAGLQSLVEGDASLVQAQYMRAKLSPLDWLRMGIEYSRLDMTALNSAPKYLSASMMFPYTQGSRFAQTLYTSGGWSAVNAAFAHPPQSTEQVLHPQHFNASDPPRIVSLPPLTDTLGSGWRLVDEEIMGEFAIQQHLQPLGVLTATLAASGWGGDRYATFYNEARDATLFAWRTEWDTTTDAAEFARTYDLYLTDRFGHAADSKDGNWMCWQASDDYRCMQRSAGAVLIVRAPDQKTARPVLDRLGP